MAALGTTRHPPPAGHPTPRGGRAAPRTARWLAACTLLLGIAGCGDADPDQAGTRAPGEAAAVEDRAGTEGTSLLGRELVSRPDTEGTAAAAEAALAESPEDVERIIAAGIARAGLWQYNAAIEHYDRGIERAPEDARLYRHRGHRYISLRRFPDAVQDLTRAAELDSLSFDILYHLGLARYLSGDFAGAANSYGRCLGHARSPEVLEMERSGVLGEGYRSCMSLADDEDAWVAIADWRYRALRRAGEDEPASGILDAVREDMAVEANVSYHQALLFYKGARAEDEILDRGTLEGNQLPTIGYGVANFHLVEGDTARALALMEEIVQSTEWPAFGTIAAETDLARLRR